MWLFMSADFLLPLCFWKVSDEFVVAVVVVNDADNDTEFNCCGKFDGWNAAFDERFFTNADVSSDGVSPMKRIKKKRND